MPDPQAATTQPSNLSGAFNQAAPKIVKLRDLQIQLEAFEKINDLGFVDRMMLDAEVRATGDKIRKGGQGLYVEGNNIFSMYVDSKFVLDAVASFRNDAKLTAQQRAYLDKLDDTIEQAVQACPDQSAKLKSGAIKPLKR